MNISRILAFLVIATAVTAGVWFHSQGGLPLDPTALRERIAEFGWVAPFGFIAISALRPILALPSAVIMTAGGLAFGVLGGTVLSSLGFSLGAILWFSLARVLGRDFVQQRIGHRLTRFDAFLSRRGPQWLAVYTALPVSVLTPVHAGAGLSSMRVAGFALWVSVGLVPRAALYSYFGDSFARGRAEVVAAGIVVAIALLAAIFVMRRMSGPAAERSPLDSTAEAVASRPDPAAASGADAEV